MHEWFDVIRFEVEAQGRKVSKTRFGDLAARSRGDINDLYERGVERLERRGEAAKVGDWVRRGAGFLAEMPILSLTAEATAARNCVSLCYASAKEDPRNGLRLVQLGEAIAAARRDRQAIRWIRTLVDPTSVATLVAIQTAARLGGTDRTPLSSQLARRAHRLVLATPADARSFDELHVLARVYRLAGKPGLAVNYALEAARRAKTERHAIAPPSLARLSERLAHARSLGVAALFGEAASAARGLADRVAVRFGDFDALDERARWAKREGAALTTAGWGYLDLDDLASATAAAEEAVAVGFTGAYELQAAALAPAPSTPVLRRLSQRHELLEQVQRVDRIYYRGHSRGDARTGGAIVAGQTRKAGVVVSKAVKFGTGK